MYNFTDKSFAALVPGDPVQQRLEPALRALDVGVEEGEHLRRGLGRTQQPGADQSHSLR